MKEEYEGFAPVGFGDSLTKEWSDERPDIISEEEWV